MSAGVIEGNKIPLKSCFCGAYLLLEKSEKSKISAWEKNKATKLQLTVKRVCSLDWVDMVVVLSEKVTHKIRLKGSKEARHTAIWKITIKRRKN